MLAEIEKDRNEKHLGTVRMLSKSDNAIDVGDPTAPRVNEGAVPLPERSRAIENEASVQQPTRDRDLSLVPYADRSIDAVGLSDDDTVATSNRGVVALSTTSTNTTTTLTELQAGRSESNMGWPQPYVRNPTPRIASLPPNALLMERSPLPHSLTVNRPQMMGVNAEVSSVSQLSQSGSSMRMDNTEPPSTPLRSTEELHEPLLPMVSSSVTSTHLDFSRPRSNRAMFSWYRGDEGQNTGESHSTSTTAITSFVCFAVMIACIIVFLDSHSCHTTTDNHQNWFPAVQRHQNLLECVATISPTVADTTFGLLSDRDTAVVSYSPPQSTAIDWFLTGPGRDVPIDAAHCVDGDFAPLYGLIVLRESVHVPDKSWYSSDHTYQSVGDMCQQHWARVTCSATTDSSGVVWITGLILGAANLTGTLPAEMLPGLQHLTSLVLHTNPALTGTLPEFISQMTQLQSLQLHGTGLSGSIPESWSRLTALQELLLDHTHISGTVPNEICQLPALKQCHVPDTVTCTCTCCLKQPKDSS